MFDNAYMLPSSTWKAIAVEVVFFCSKRERTELAVFLLNRSSYPFRVSKFFLTRRYAAHY